MDLIQKSIDIHVSRHGNNDRIGGISIAVERAHVAGTERLHRLQGTHDGHAEGMTAKQVLFGQIEDVLFGFVLVRSNLLGNHVALLGEIISRKRRVHENVAQ